MTFSRRALVVSAALACLSLQPGCEYPYAPERQPALVVEAPTLSALREINGTNQICNPSITQNETYFAGCMLWLNLGGVAVDTSLVSGYDLNASVHDRLTITNDSNKVRWYMHVPSFVVGGQFQDPEWSNHNDYAAVLGLHEYGMARGYAVRISDKSMFLFHTNLVPTSTPFVWLPDTGDVQPDLAAAAPTAVTNPTSTFDADSLVDSASVHDFFGTNNVKFVFSMTDGALGQSLYYIDYSVAAPAMQALRRPAGVTGNCESPLVSPDGKWIVFQVLQPGNERTLGSYVQRLDAAAAPILIDDGAAEPHWWQDPYGSGSPLYVVYATARKVADAFLEGKNDNGSLGVTYLQQITLPSDPSITVMPTYRLFSSAPEEMIKWPFQGGLSRSGIYMCTGYLRAYTYVFETASLAKRLPK